MNAPLLIERDGPVLTITLNRAERRNTLSSETIAALRDAIVDDDAAVIVLGSTGSVFSAGHDLREMSERDPAFYDALFRACGELMLAIHRLPQPVIAKVQGGATAAGCQLVAACDLAMAARSARFATPGVRIGLFCTTPMVEVARAVGRKRAMQMLLTGDFIDARTAMEWGLVNDVVPDEDLDTATMDLARRIATSSRSVLAVGKRAFYANLDHGLAGAYDHASAVMAASASDPDAQEGFRAFLDKREPIWRGSPSPAPQ
jgi:enoyl-CoA hydratase/carnithine racemase